jgi:hypothetical protein
LTTQRKIGRATIYISRRCWQSSRRRQNDDRHIIVVVLVVVVDRGRRRLVVVRDKIAIVVRCASWIVDTVVIVIVVNVVIRRNDGSGAVEFGGRGERVGVDGVEVKVVAMVTDEIFIDKVVVVVVVVVNGENWQCGIGVVDDGHSAGAVVDFYCI